jgi:hypothetical protein
MTGKYGSAYRIRLSQQDMIGMDGRLSLFHEEVRRTWICGRLFLLEGVPPVISTMKRTAEICSPFRLSPISVISLISDRFVISMDKLRGISPWMDIRDI